MFTIDHLVLPSISLDAARHRLSLLGFTVAADARHPFGTGNACVFMRDGIYLEPLSIVDAALYGTSVAAGNVFVRDDRAFRAMAGENGFSALALSTDNAAADHARFNAADISGGDMLEFSRLARLPDGSEKLARFHLAFAARGAGDSFGVFTCQRLDPLPADRAALERHDNGVVALAEIILVAAEMVGTAARMEQVLATSPQYADPDSATFDARNGTLRVVTAKRFAKEFDEAEVPPAGLMGAAIVFRVSDLAVTRAMLAANDVAFMDKGDRITVAAAPGQGAVFAFEE